MHALLKFWAGGLTFLLVSGFVIWTFGIPPLGFPSQHLGVTTFCSVIVLGFLIVVDSIRFSSSRERKAEERRRKEAESIVQKRLEKVKRLEISGRFEDAAREYERLGMYEKAGEMRARTREKQVIVKRLDVSVDLNTLLKQIKDGGIVIVYRCPHCNAPLKIGKDTNAESLRVCGHCGSEIEAMELADFMKTALS